MAYYVFANLEMRLRRMWVSRTGTSKRAEHCIFVELRRYPGTRVQVRNQFFYGRGAFLGITGLFFLQRLPGQNLGPRPRFVGWE